MRISQQFFLAKHMSIFGLVLVLGVGGLELISQEEKVIPGGPLEPIRYIGKEHINADLADGGLPLAVGAQNYQVLRSSRLYPEVSDGQGWTFQHAPMLAYWRGKFYVEFISSPVQENGVPTNVMMASSADGRRWSMPALIFPQWNSYRDLQHPILSQLHQRMGFYVAPNDRLLVLSHYGLWDNEKNHIFGGPGHVVREVYDNGSVGPIYFIRYGEGWNSSNAFYPFYRESPDRAFVQACDDLLANPFVTDQWYELEKGYPPDAYIKIAGSYQGKASASEADEQRKALSFFHREDGAVVGIWKMAWTAISTDKGKTWSVPVQAPGFAKTFAKLWGQHTSDGRYAIAYDPNDSHPAYRWPLAVATSKDGITFDQLLVVHGEVPLRRYPGKYKDPGPQYVRGIAEGDPQPPDGAMWLVYSMNKEDIWVSRIPVPIQRSVDHPVDDTFDNMEPGGVVNNWNIYSPRWAPVAVVPFPSVQNKSLQLKDGDPYDYARATRVFPESRKGSLAFKMLAKRPLSGELDIEIGDAQGHRPVRIALDPFGEVQITNGSLVTGVTGYASDQWLSFKIEFDTTTQKFTLWIDEKPVLRFAAFAEPVETLERVSFRTSPYRPVGLDQQGYFVGDIDPTTDSPLAEPATYYLDDVRSQTY